MPSVDTNGQPVNRPQNAPQPAPKSGASTPRQSTGRQNASRENGGKSKGPVTPEGKARSSQNACKYGFNRTENVLLPNEDPEEFRELRRSLNETFAPEGVLEQLLVNRIIVCHWRLRRVLPIETETLNNEIAPNVYGFTSYSGPAKVVFLGRYETAIERSMYRALNALETAQNKRRAEKEKM